MHFGQVISVMRLLYHLHDKVYNCFVWSVLWSRFGTSFARNRRHQRGIVVFLHTRDSCVARHEREPRAAHAPADAHLPRVWTDATDAGEGVLPRGMAAFKLQGEQLTTFTFSHDRLSNLLSNA